MRFCIATWNVQGADPGYVTQTDVIKWLKEAPKKETSKNPFKHQIPNLPVDIYAIGLQEIIPMDKKIKIPVPKLFFKGAGPFDITRTSIRDKILWAWSTLLVKGINSFEREAQYSLYGAYLLNGVAMFVIVRDELIGFNHIKKGRADTVRADKTPSDLEIMLIPDNKASGAVGIRFECGGSSIAIINAHLKGGEGILACAERNKQFNKIAGEMFRDADLSLQQHEYVFWMGDLNYRICGSSIGAPTPRDVWNFEKRGELNLLLQADELRTQMKSGTAFQGYNEGEVNFSPTFPYLNFMSKEKRPEKRPGAFATLKRRDYSVTPAWTNRILWTRNNIHGVPETTGFEGGLAAYALASDVGKISSHLPIVALIDVEIMPAPFKPQMMLQQPRRPDMFIGGRPVSPGPMFQAAPLAALPAPPVSQPPAIQWSQAAPPTQLPATIQIRPTAQQPIVQPLVGVPIGVPQQSGVPTVYLQAAQPTPLPLPSPFSQTESFKKVFSNFILPKGPVL